MPSNLTLSTTTTNGQSGHGGQMATPVGMRPNHSTNAIMECRPPVLKSRRRGSFCGSTLKSPLRLIAGMRRSTTRGCECSMQVDRHSRAVCVCFVLGWCVSWFMGLEDPRWAAARNTPPPAKSQWHIRVIKNVCDRRGAPSVECFKFNFTDSSFEINDGFCVSAPFRTSVDGRRECSPPSLLA